MRHWTARLVAFFAIISTGLPAHANITNRDNYAAIIVDARGQTLLAANADDQRFPASLTKMMTLYMLFEAMGQNRVSTQTRITMSAEAASRPATKLGLPAGYSLSAEDAILALITRSANDVAAAIAEHLGGSEERFAQMMTQRARSLGMTRSTFRNASGLPDPEQTTTARDMATLGRRLQADFPQQYAYFGTTQFRWNSRPIHNHNHMLSSYEGTDGIKTGYTRWSGFNIVTSARRDGVRLVGAVLGGGSWGERDRHMAELMDDAFSRSGVARRANSYDAMLTNRGAPREAEPRQMATALRIEPGPRVALSQGPTGANRQFVAARPASSRAVAAREAGRGARPEAMNTSASVPAGHPGRASRAPAARMAARPAAPPQASPSASPQAPPPGRPRASGRAAAPQSSGPLADRSAAPSRSAMAQAPRTPFARPRPVELREPLVRPNPARPVSRT